MTERDDPLHSPLQECHERLGATFTDFAGWHLPLRFASELAEHRAVRAGVGVFDISHMAQFDVVGDAALQLIDRAVTNDIASLAPGRARYTLMCNDLGGVVDDLIVYRILPERLLVIANAANRSAVAAGLERAGRGLGTSVRDVTLERALLSIQGPFATRTLAACASDPVEATPRFAIASTRVAGRDVLAARTGYTGEDGFEIVLARADAEAVWTRLLETNVGAPVVPAGLAARDSLRLEAALPLYGHELLATTTPFDAGLGRFVHLENDFVGRDALVRRSHEPPTVKLIGLLGNGPRAARVGYSVLSDAGEHVGEITSGAPSPTLGVPIAMAYVPAALGEEDAVVDVDVRGKAEPFQVTPLPFYRRPKTP